MNRILGAAALRATLILALSIVTGCDVSNDSGSTTSAGGPNVSIVDSTIPANPIEIQVGESVTWRNQDPLTHWLVGDGGIDSGELKQYYSYTKTFDSPGTYPYKCKLHPSMTGEVIVK